VNVEVFVWRVLLEMYLWWEVGVGNLTEDFVLEYLNIGYVFVLLAAEPHICIPHIRVMGMSRYA